MENQTNSSGVELSKRERRQLRREAERQGLAPAGGSGGGKRLIIWLVGIVVIVGVVVGLVVLAKNQRPVVEAGILAVPVAATGEWIEGNPAATTTLVEYSDFQCPACGFYYPLVKKLSVDFKNDLRIVYRNFPLRSTHANAQMSAQAAGAAGAQGKFWEMHDKLFAGQKVWSDESDPAKTFATYAADIGLDLEKFRADLNSQAIKDKIENDFQGGVRAGVDSTPSFFLNGRKIINPATYDEFSQLIKQAITASSTPVNP